MGSLANQAASTELVAAAPQRGIKELLRSQWPRIQAVMPKHMSSERLYQLAVSSINQTPGLAEATIPSLLACVMKCSALGLEPSAVDGLGRAYILPYNNRKTGKTEANFILGYKGIIELARRSGKLLDIEAKPVWKDEVIDLWTDDEGTHITHHQSLDGAHHPEDLRGVYCIAILVNGDHVHKHIEYMSRDEVETIRLRSKARDFGPWKTDYVAMAKKTVVRRAAPYLPMSVDAQTAVAADETTPDYSAVLSPIIEPEPEQVPEYTVEPEPDGEE